MRSGPVWSHVLASILGGVVVAGVLLAFGVIGRPPTETVPITNVTTPTVPSGTTPSSGAGDIYLRDAPGVVSIRATVARRTTSPFIAGTEPAGSVAVGSGVLISSKGYVLTAFHVIQGAVSGSSRPILVRLDAEQTRVAEVVEESQADDVALLKVNLHGVPPQIRPLPLGHSRGVGVGDDVLAISDAGGGSRTIRRGIVSALATQLNGPGGGISGVIETDLPGDPAASGGPLLDAGGTVIGILSEVAPTGGEPAIAFAVPIDTARSIIPTGVLR